MEIVVHDIAALPQAARTLLDALGGKPHVLAFHAGMGVGKTTFISALCRELGVEQDQVNSPTFAIINEYDGAEGPIYHFDLYRLEDEMQAMEIGAAEYLESGEWCFVEWPQNTPGIIPSEAVNIYMSEEADGTRIISIPSLP